MSNTSHIKRSQKESLLFKEISSLFMQATLDDPRLKDIFISKVALSKDKGLCTVYFYSNKGREYFNSVLEILKLYKPSLRKALASKVKSRYVPELIFKFDDLFEKHFKLEQILEQIKTEKPDKTDS